MSVEVVELDQRRGRQRASEAVAMVLPAASRSVAVRVPVTGALPGLLSSTRARTDFFGGQGVGGFDLDAADRDRRASRFSQTSR